jgi:hypothetical protein
MLSAAVVLLWGFRLPGLPRRGLALLCSLAGLGFLALALNTEGHRHAATTTQYLFGTAQVTDYASASASLPFYVLTAACLLLGTLGLAISDDLAQRMGEHALALALAVSIFMTLLRFALEKAAAPDLWTQAVGVTWLAPLVGTFFASRVGPGQAGLRELCSLLLIYGLLVRGFVAMLMVVASVLHLGSHYDVSGFVNVRNPISGQVYEYVAGSLGQVLNLAVVPQLTFWVVYTLLAGLLGGGALLLASSTLLPADRLNGAAAR